MLGPTSARQFFLLAQAFIPTTATARATDFLPSTPKARFWRASRCFPASRPFPGPETRRGKPYNHLCLEKETHR